MAIKYGDPGYKYYRDYNGKVYGLRDYWYAKKDNRNNTLSLKVVNNAVNEEWYCFIDLDYLGYGEKYMCLMAEKKVDELNARDHCVIPCTVI